MVGRTLTQNYRPPHESFLSAGFGPIRVFVFPTRRLADLARMRKLLKGLIAECESGKRSRSCPIIATLLAAA